MPADAKSRLKCWGTVIFGAGLLMVVSGAAYWLLTPREFEAAVRIRPEQQDWKRSGGSTNYTRGREDSGFIHAEYHLIRSEPIVDQVIEELGLRKTWGLRHPGGAALGTNEARVEFAAKVSFIPPGNAGVLEVRVKSREREETAKIANAIAGAYKHSREKQKEEQSGETFQQLKQQVEAQNEKLVQARARLAELYRQLNMADAKFQNPVEGAGVLEQLEAQRMSAQAQYDAAQNSLEQLKGLSNRQLTQRLLATAPDGALRKLADELTRAESDSEAAKKDFGSASPEVQRADALTENLRAQVKARLNGILLAKEAEASSLKAVLKAIEEQLEQARRTSLQIASNSSVYMKAQQQVEALAAENEKAYHKMDQAAVEALLPKSVAVEIVDPAETPVKPVSPNERVAKGMVYGGAGVSLAGLLVGLIAFARKERMI
ncbi:MAG TPA: hypothetical protein VH598_03480 [Verrucomicrobiae bacterium]|nr:hypothetical protein [Verrucomicrobiae bacterium]